MSPILRTAPLLALLALTSAACSSGSPATRPAAAPFRCDTPMPGVDALVAPGAVVLFGEIHGTREIPDAFGRAVCSAAAAASTEVLVGVEIPRTEQAALDAFVASDGGDAARAALLAGAFWTGPWKDGRSSEAMVALLDRVRALRAAGARVRVVAFDVGATPAPDRDGAMAAALLDARAAAPDAVVVLLTGNLHARLAGGLPPLPDMVPMGAHLRDAAPATVSFDARHAAGTAWVCTGETPADCGAQPWGEAPTAKPAGVEPLAAAEPHGFTGVFHVGGPVSASPPAVP